MMFAASMAQNLNLLQAKQVTFRSHVHRWSRAVMLNRSPRLFPVWDIATRCGLFFLL